MTDEEAVARCRAIPAEIDAHRDAIVALAAERAALVRGLRRKGYGLAALARLLGVSKPRVQQLSGGGLAPAGSGGRVRPGPGQGAFLPLSIGQPPWRGGTFGFARGR